MCAKGADIATAKFIKFRPGYEVLTKSSEDPMVWNASLPAACLIFMPRCFLRARFDARYQHKSTRNQPCSSSGRCKVNKTWLFDWHEDGLHIHLLTAKGQTEKQHFTCQVFLCVSLYNICSPIDLLYERSTQFSYEFVRGCSLR